MGLLSPGGVHSHQDHIVGACAHPCRRGPEGRLHAFLDGRDTPPQSALGFLETFRKSISDLPQGTVATVSGRYYAMDRDKRWERVAKAYEAIVEARGARFPDAETAIAAILCERRE